MARAQEPVLEAARNVKETPSMHRGPSRRAHRTPFSLPGRNHEDLMAIEIRRDVRVRRDAPLPPRPPGQ
jgi:hypothetical protein